MECCCVCDRSRCFCFASFTFVFYLVALCDYIISKIKRLTLFTPIHAYMKPRTHATIIQKITCLKFLRLVNEYYLSHATIYLPVVVGDDKNT